MSLFGGPSGNISQPPGNTPESSSDEDDNRLEMAVEAPRVKRVKYVTLVFLSKPGTSATNTVYRYNLTESFSVLVGTGPSRQHFTVHHELITQRSEFFRAARSARWTKRKKATKLVDDKPHIFSAYLNCLYLGAGFMIKQPKTDNIEGSAAEVEEAKKITKAKDQETLEFFVELYLLADKLLDPGTANLVIDELISFVDTLSWVSDNSSITHVYDHTVDGNPLRQLLVDYHIHEATPDWFNKDSKATSQPPLEFLQDIIIENGRLQAENPQGVIERVFRNYATSRPKDHYHQKVEQKLEVS